MAILQRAALRHRAFLAVVAVLSFGCSQPSEGNPFGLPQGDGGGDGTDPGIPPAPVLDTLAVAPATLALGTVYLGQTRTHPVVVTNTTGSAITISSVLTSRGVSHGLSLPATVPAGGSLWFHVTLSPPSAGALTRVVSLRDADGAILRDVRVNATAAALDDTSALSVVDYGARGDGATDDRGAFQAAANAARDAGKVLYVPQPPGGQHYKLTGVVRISGSVVGEPGGAKPEIRMYGATGADSPGDAPPHAIFYYKGNRAGTVITGLHLNGGRDFAPWTNVYGMQEQSHAIALQDVSDLWIENNLIENTQGDNILIGGERGTSPCEDVRVVNNVLRRPMRCAVFPGDTRRLRVYLNTIDKVVEYQSTIDFEPNLVPQASWDAEVAYNDFTNSLQYDHGVITSTIVTYIPAPGGQINVHSNWGTSGSYSFYVDISPGSTWVGNTIQSSLLPPR